MFWHPVGGSEVVAMVFCLSDLPGFSNATDAFDFATGLCTCIVKAKLSCSCLCDTTRTRGSLIPESVCLQQASPNFKVKHLRDCRGHNTASGPTRAFSLFQNVFFPLGPFWMCWDCRVVSRHTLKEQFDRVHLGQSDISSTWNSDIQAPLILSQSNQSSFQCPGCCQVISFSKNISVNRGKRAALEDFRRTMGKMWTRTLWTIPSSVR